MIHQTTLFHFPLFKYVLTVLVLPVEIGREVHTLSCDLLSLLQVLAPLFLFNQLGNNIELFCELLFVLLDPFLKFQHQVFCISCSLPHVPLCDVLILNSVLHVRAE
jgi:hypothetical protein